MLSAAVTVSGGDQMIGKARQHGMPRHERLRVVGLCVLFSDALLVLGHKKIGEHGMSIADVLLAAQPPSSDCVISLVFGCTGQGT